MQSTLSGIYSIAGYYMVLTGRRCPSGIIGTLWPAKFHAAIGTGFYW